MNQLTLKTNLRCAACVEKIRSALDADPRIHRWTTDVTVPEKWLTVEGTELSRDVIDGILRPLGYQVLGESPPAILKLPVLNSTPEPTSPPVTYYPLVLILIYLVLVTVGVEITAGSFDAMRWMRHFMAGFFLVFSFFKLLNVSAFADAYSGYDVLAARWRGWGVIYPFVELSLGLAFLTNAAPRVTNLVTVVVMGISTLGVIRSLLARQKIRCACLGSVFNLPMSAVTLVEDVLMVGMSAAMLALM